MNKIKYCLSKECRLFLGLTLHNFGFILSVVGEKGIANKFLSILGLLLIIISFFQYGFKNNRSNILTILVSVLLIYETTIIFRFEENIFDLTDPDVQRKMFFDERFFLSYFLPFICFLKKVNFRAISCFCLINLCIAVIMLITFRNEIVWYDTSEYSSWIVESICLLAIPVSLLLYLSFTISKRTVIFIIISYLVLLLTSIWLGRRSVSFELIIALLIFVYLNAKNKKVFMGCIILLILAYPYIGKLYNSDNSRLKDRMEIDNRSPEDKDALNSLTGIYYFFGKGIDGEYYSHTYAMKRGIVETGFSHMMLKGGFVFVFLYIIIMIRAIFLGFFYSKNKFSKGLAFYVLVQLVSMYPLPIPTMNLQCFILWYSIALLDNKGIRYTNDDHLLKTI